MPTDTNQNVAVSNSKTSMDLISPKVCQSKIKEATSGPEPKAPIKVPAVVDSSKSRWIILHYRRSKILWDWLILSLTYYTAVVVPLVTAFHIHSRSTSWMVIDSVFDVLFLVEIVINFHTSYVSDKGKLVTSLNEIRVHYATTWFSIDLLSSLPYETVNLFVSEIREQRLAALLGVLKALKLLRLVRIARDIDRYLQHTWATLVALVFLLLLITHWMACGWYAIALMEVRRYMIKSSDLHSVPRQESNELDDELSNQLRELPIKNWLLRLSDDTDRPFIYNKTTGTLNGGPSVHTAYASSMYFTMTSVTSAGFGNIGADTADEMLYCIFILLLGALLFAIILGNVTNILQQINASDQEFSSHLRAIKSFAKLYELPSKLTEAVCDYVTYKWMVTHGIDSEQVLNYFPQHKQVEIRVQLHNQVLQNQPVFKALNENGIWIIAKDLKKCYAAPDDIICDKGEQLDAIYFIISGCVEVSQDGAIIALLTNNDCFGTYFWSDGCNDVTHMRSEATVKSLTYANLDLLPSSSLIEAMEKFPSIDHSFRTQLQLTFDLRRFFNFRTLTSVEWEKEANHNPAVARKHDRLRKWLRKIKAKKSARDSMPARKSAGDLSSKNDRKLFTDFRHSFLILFKKIRYGVGFLRKNEIEPVRAIPKIQIEAHQPKNQIIEIKKEKKKIEENKRTTVNSGNSTEPDEDIVAAPPQFKCRKCGKIFNNNCSNPNQVQSNEFEIKKVDNFGSTTNISHQTLDYEKEHPKLGLGDSLPVDNTNDKQADDTMIIGRCFQVTTDETDMEEWTQTGTIEFSLEEKKWMHFGMSDTTRKTFLDMLDFKLNFNKSLVELESNLSLLKDKLDVLTKDIGK